MWDEYQYLPFNIKRSLLFNPLHWWSSTTCEPDLILKRPIQINLFNPQGLSILKAIWELYTPLKMIGTWIVLGSAILSCSPGNFLLGYVFIWQLFGYCGRILVYSFWLILVFHDIWIPFLCLTGRLASSLLGWLVLNKVLACPLPGLILALSHYPHLMSTRTLRLLACASTGLV